jgi:hypothetical protein
MTCSKHNGSYSIILIAGILAIAFLYPKAFAKSDNLRFNFQLKAGYNDNILRYSDADLDQFDSTTVDSSLKFGIKSKDDFIIVPVAEIVYKTKILGHNFNSGLKLSYNFYTKNSVKRYASMGLWLREFLKKDTYFQLRLAYIPDYYYRNLFVTHSMYAKAEFNKITTEARLVAPLHKNVMGDLFYYYENKDFNRLFNERDLKAHHFGAELTLQTVNLWKAWGGYEYCFAKSAGRDNPLDRRDTSYDSFLVLLGTRFYLKGYQNRELQAGASCAYKAVLFQTNKLTEEDRYRFGRKDNNWTINFTLKQNVTKYFDIGLEYSHVINNTDLPAAELTRFLEYKGNLINIVFDYSF